MTQLRLVILLSVFAAFWCISVIDTASVRPQDFFEKLQRLVLEDAESRGIRIERSVEANGNGEQQKPRNCYSTPCGWAVYVPFTRRVDYFMKNTCECPDETYKCVRTDDDLSVSAYVYRCRQNTTSADIEPPEDVANM